MKTGFTRVSEVALEDGGNVASGHFEFLPKNVVVLRDDSEPRVARPPPVPTRAC